MFLGSNKRKKNVDNPRRCPLIPPRRRFHRELRQLSTRHHATEETRLTFQQVTCFFIEEGEGEEGGSYAVLRRRSAVLVTRSANCEHRNRL